jgi:hypothetical protein
MGAGGLAIAGALLGTPFALAEELAVAIDEALARGAGADAAADADAEGAGAGVEAGCSAGPLAGAPIIARTRGSHRS